MILLTHAHFDHIMGCNELIEASGAKLYAFCEEQLLCENPKVNLSTSFHQPYTVKPDVYLKEGDTVTMGDVSCKVIATPGHTKGSCCFYFEEAGFKILKKTYDLHKEPIWENNIETEHEKMFSEQGIKIKALIATRIL